VWLPFSGPLLAIEGDDEGIRLNSHSAVTLHLNNPRGVTPPETESLAMVRSSLPEHSDLRLLAAASYHAPAGLFNASLWPCLSI
jgi:hypothetical protein